MKLRRSPTAWMAAALLALLAAGPVFAMDDLRIDHLRIVGRHRHIVVLSVREENSAASGGGQGRLHVKLDGREVKDFDERLRTSIAGRLTVVVDAGLLIRGGESVGGIEDLIREVAKRSGANDEIEIYSVAQATRHRAWKASELLASPSEIASLAQSGTPRLYDGLTEATAAASKHRGLSMGTVLLITAGEDDGSRHRLNDVIEEALRSGGITSILVALVDGSRPAAEADKLSRLAVATHGDVRHLTPGMPAPPAFFDALQTLQTRHELTFLPPDWDRSLSEHHLVVEVERGVGSMTAEQSYAESDVAEYPWWASARVWILFLVLIAVAAGIVWLLTPRQLGLLVVQGGEDDGTWFEFFDLPVTIGSGQGNDVLIAVPGVSRNHCMLQREDRDIVILDMKSGEGTFVNGTRIQKRVLEDADVITLGSSVELEFEART